MWVPGTRPGRGARRAPSVVCEGGDLPGKAGEKLNNLTSSNILYSGRLPLLAAPHAMTGLVQGIMATGRRVRGRCEVRGQRVDMWALVAQAMGFSVVRMRWADSAFAQLLQGYGIHAKTSKLGKFRAKPQEVELVFGDMESLGPPQSRPSYAPYWKQWVCPHVFFCAEGGDDSPPPGWTVTRTVVSHRHVGGSTDAVWSLVLWLPPGWVPLPLVPVPVQPWVPVLARVNRRNRSIGYVHISL